MDKNNKTLWAMLITAVILVAVFSAFWLNLFRRQTPEVVLPTASASSGEEGPGDEEPDLNGAVPVEVTAQTVQSVIATLTRPESYNRDITLETFWGEDGAALSSAQVWADGGYTHIVSLLPDGTVEHTIVGEGKRWRWYNNGGSVFCVDAQEEDADLMQRVPTYEDILALDTADITDAGYEEKNGLACVYVETADWELGSRTRYWVSVELGLLVGAESVKDEQVVLRVSGYSVELPIREGLRFALPDGTVLHTPLSD